MAVDAHNNRYKPCCLYQADSWPKEQSLQQYWRMQPLQDLRNNLKTGVQDVGCRACWQLESLGQTSMRQSINVSRQVDPDVDPVIRQVKLITGKTCNLSCMMCFSTVSTSYQSLWGNKLEWSLPANRQWELEYDSAMDAYIRSHADQLEFIEVLGGEPLFSKRFLDLVEHLAATGAANHLTLYVITNGTLLTQEMIASFKKFKKTVFVVSVDGVGPVNEYQRWPSSWSQVQSHLEILQRDFDVSINPTVTAVNILGLPDLYEYCDRRSLHMGGISLVQGWPQLLPKNLPDTLRKQVDQRFSSLAQGEPDVDGLLTFIDKWDQQRGIQIADYMPEWQGLI
jgi:sulfatase maturation enzyme AslB (radical SAM superfamily)